MYIYVLLYLCACVYIYVYMLIYLYKYIYIGIYIHYIHLSICPNKKLWGLKRPPRLHCPLQQTATDCNKSAIDCNILHSMRCVWPSDHRESLNKLQRTATYCQTHNYTSCTLSLSTARPQTPISSVLRRVAVCCCALRCVAVCCRKLLMPHSCASHHDYIIVIVRRGRAPA